MSGKTFFWRQQEAGMDEKMTTDERTLNQRIASAIYGSEIRFLPSEWGQYIIDSNGDTLASLEDYEHSVDATLAALPEGYTPHGYDLSIRNFTGGGYVASIYQDDDPPMAYTYRWVGRGETRAQAAARALEQWALSQKAHTP